jgi:hypothetical protein
MKKFTTLIAVAAVAAMFAAPSFALSPTNDIVMTDHSMRSSKLIGATVYNDQGQSIGSVIDVLVRGASVEPTVILSVGDFVGGGAKLVALPLSHVNLDGAKPMMAGATRQMLASMPTFLFRPIENNGQG